jgi:uncharacterized protein (TIGR03435 family)
MVAREAAGALFVLLLHFNAFAQGAFEVASIKPNTSGATGWSISYTADSWRAANATLSSMIQAVYGIRDDRLEGGPAWVKSTRFDVTGKAAQALPSAELRLLARRLLESRFGVVLTRERREQEVYALRLARTDGRLGPDLRRAEDDCLATAGTSPTDQPERPRARSSTGLPSNYAGWCTTLANIARGLSRALSVEVVDDTGLPGRWDFVVAFAPLAPDVAPAVGQGGTNLPTVFAAVEEQLGLTLDRNARGSVEYVVITSAHPPTEN